MNRIARWLQRMGICLPIAETDDEIRKIVHNAYREGYREASERHLRTLRAATRMLAALGHLRYKLQERRDVSSIKCLDTAVEVYQGANPPLRKNHPCMDLEIAIQAKVVQELQSLASIRHLKGYSDTHESCH